MKFAALVLCLLSSIAFATNGPTQDLIGGTVTDQARWPASGFGRSGSSGCSYTIVGERVLLTAAHCVRDGGSFTFARQGINYSAICTHHPQYSQAAWDFAASVTTPENPDDSEPQIPVGATEDWALCVTNAVVQGVTYEVIATDPNEVACASGLQVTLSGFGCTRWGGSIDGQFRTGVAPSTQCPSTNSQDLVTRGTTALCSGDSGGGAYIVKSDGSRKYVGTNSRSNTTTTSYLSATFGPKFGSWARSWAALKQVQVCGLTQDARGCLDNGSPDPEPRICTSELAEVERLHALQTGALVTLNSCMGSVFGD